MNKTEEIFSKIGGDFVTPFFDIKEKMRHIRAYLFDWDGVFNAGIKGEGTNSTYSEVDSMGTNLLRFGHWLNHNALPLFGIITGQNNMSALQLSKREHFDFAYSGFINKLDALDHIQQTFQVEPDQVAFIFDDVLDLSVAEKCGLRFFINRSASPLLNAYVADKHMCDYITAHGASDHAVREVCELMLGISGVFFDVVDERIVFDNKYKQYLSLRNTVSTTFYATNEGGICKI